MGHQGGQGRPPMYAYTIHNRPTDFPDQVVVTRDLISSPLVAGRPVRDAGFRFLCDTVGAARVVIQTINPYAACFPRDPSDPPYIVETWI